MGKPVVLAVSQTIVTDRNGYFCFLRAVANFNDQSFFVDLKPRPDLLDVLD